MKKIIGLLMIMVFCFGVAGINTADAAVKKAVKKAAKSSVKKQAIKKPAPALTPVAPPQPSTVVPVTPPPLVAKPAPVVAKPVAAGIFGLGLDSDVVLNYQSGSSLVGGGADIYFGDPLMLASMVGLKADSLKWRLGLAGATGNDINNNSYKTVILAYDGVLSLPSDMLGGVESYIGGGLNYVVYGTGRINGGLGGQAYVGVQGDLGLGSKSFLELGYSIIRSPSQSRSAKGFSVSIGQTIKL